MLHVAKMVNLFKTFSGEFSYQFYLLKELFIYLFVLTSVICLQDMRQIISSGVSGCIICWHHSPGERPIHERGILKKSSYC